MIAETGKTYAAFSNGKIDYLFTKNDMPEWHDDFPVIEVTGLDAAIGDDVIDGKHSKAQPSNAHVWNGSEWIFDQDLANKIAEAEANAMIPKSVTMRQARLALLKSGLLDKMKEYMEDEATDVEKLEWEFSSEVLRYKTTVLDIAEKLEINENDLNELFILAATL